MSGVVQATLTDKELTSLVIVLDESRRCTTLTEEEQRLYRKIVAWRDSVICKPCRSGACQWIDPQSP